jgi:hypothetical protein
MINKESMIENILSSTVKPFVVSPSKHERLGHPPFDRRRLRVNDVGPIVKGGKEGFHPQCL